MRQGRADYDALLDILKGGAIAGAALDVYPVEPLPADSPPQTLHNVVLSPHLAGASTRVVRHHSRQIVDDFVSSAGRSRSTLPILRCSTPDSPRRHRGADRLVNSQAGGDQCVCDPDRSARLMAPRRTSDGQRRLRVLP